MGNPNSEIKDTEPVAVEITSTDARSQLGSLINRAAFGGETFTILKHGKPIAALIGAREFEALKGAA